MTTTIERRVRALESGGGRECPVCGFQGDWSKVEIRVNVRGDTPGPDNCPECGRPLVLRVGWGGTEKRLTRRYREGEGGS